MKKHHPDEVAITLIYLTGIIWLILNQLYNIKFLLCPTKLLFGVPCPGCGMTRATISLLNGNVTEALATNPNIIIAAILCIIAPPLLICQFFFNKDLIGRINLRLNTPIFLIPFCLFEMSIWVYNIYRDI